MLLRRIYEEMLSQASYVIACGDTDQAIVIDPHRDIDVYLELARTEKLAIAYVTETHIHADFVSGARELARATGATLLVSGEGGTDWQYAFANEPGVQVVRDGDVIEIGNVDIDVLHTPGHTPEHVSFLVTDTAHSSEPMGMISGDFVFVGDVGRPDLLERAANIGGTMEGLAKQLYASIQRTKSLPAHLQIWPGHGAGSACGKALGDVPSSTLGYERLVNWAFRAPDEASFVAEVLIDQPEPPKYFVRMKTVNRDGPTRAVDPSRVMRMSADEFNAAVATGAVVVDVRSTAHFAAGHMTGSLNIPTGASFPTWLGSLVDPARPIIFIVGADEGRRARALHGASLVGMDNIVGWGGPEIMQHSVANGRRPMTTVALDPREVAASDRKIIDVRGASEWAHEHIDRATHAFLGDLVDTLKDYPKDAPLAMQCQGGSRSAIAVSLLQAEGFTNVVNLKGGLDGWVDAGLPVTKS